MRGDDLRYDLEVAFSDAVFGSAAEIMFTRHEACDPCHGTGVAGGARRTICPSCGGSGQVRRSSGFFSIASTCPQCEGAGDIVEHPCQDCRGSGRQRRNRRIKITIPAGIEPGKRIQIPGEGDGASGSRPPGDLYVYIHIQPHEFFERHGNDLYCVIRVGIVQAALGAEIVVPTLDRRRVKVRIPSGTQNGKMLRLRNEGVPYRGERNRRGNLYIRVLVKVPDKMPARARGLLEEFAPHRGGRQYPATRPPGRARVVAMPRAAALAAGAAVAALLCSQIVVAALRTPAAPRRAEAGLVHHLSRGHAVPRTRPGQRTGGSAGHRSVAVGCGCAYLSARDGERVPPGWHLLAAAANGAVLGCLIIGWWGTYRWLLPMACTAALAIYPWRRLCGRRHLRKGAADWYLCGTGLLPVAGSMADQMAQLLGATALSLAVAGVGLVALGSGFFLAQLDYLRGAPGAVLSGQMRRLQRLRRRLEAAEENLLLQNRLETVGYLTAGVAHEFRNILSHIKTTAEWGLDAAAPPDATRALRLIRSHVGAGGRGDQMRCLPPCCAAARSRAPRSRYASNLRR